jgi:2-methylcitrate dehydratase PrpD
MAAASALSDDAQPFVRLASEQGVGGRAQIMGTALRATAPLAALANGALAHALDYEDAFDRAPVHPNASLLPAAVAIAQAHGPVSGREFVAAVAIGCDLSCRIALSLRQPLEAGGWYPPAILGAFGATAAAARLLRLSAVQVRDAFSLLLCQNVCPGEIKYSEGTVIRAVREAFPAQAAVTSALLASGGVRGFEQPLEGRAGFYQLFAGGRFEPAELLDGLGRSFLIEELSFKPWPCCRGTHAYIEAAQYLRRLHRIAVTDIEKVIIQAGPVQRMLCEPLARKQAPTTIIDAKFSLPYTIALALLQDHIDLDSFAPQRLHDPARLALAARCEIAYASDWGLAQATTGELTLLLRNGQRHSHKITEALGHPNRALDAHALRDKFLDCVAHARVPLAGAAAARYAEHLLQLDSAADAGLALTYPAG